MKPLVIILPAVLLFFCLWTAFLARFKGYSAACWFLGGGALGVAVLCLLPPASPLDRARRRRGNLLGLLWSGLSVLVLGWVARRAVHGFPF